MKTVIAFLLMMVPALAAPVADTFSNPVTEARARNLQRQLRCLVCQGESIDESGSPFADDVRHLVRQQIADGRSDQQIQDFLVARYGDFILMKPPFDAGTYALWLTPFAVLIAGIGVSIWVVRRSKPAPQA